MLLFGIVVFIFVIVCIVLCLLVLIQSDKGGGISATLGGGFAGANALLGSSDTANILTRGTTLFAAVYASLCIILTVMLGFSHTDQAETKSVLKERAEKTPASILDNRSSMPIMGGSAPATQPSSPGIPAPEAPAAGSQSIPLNTTPAIPAGSK